MADQKPAPALEGAGAAQEKAPVAKKKTALRTIVKDRKKGEQLEAIKRIEANLKEALEGYAQEAPVACVACVACVARVA